MESLINQVGHSTAQRLLRSTITYPKTDRSEIKSVYVRDFDGHDLGPVLVEMNQNIELMATGESVSAFAILHVLSAVQKEVLVPMADSILIIHNSEYIIHLRNTCQPNSGRSIQINISSFKNSLSAELRNFKPTPCNDLIRTILYPTTAELAVYILGIFVGLGIHCIVFGKSHK